MAISSTVASQLCTTAELQLFTDSLARNVKNLDAKALKSRITRARKARDKFRSKADRQDREARGKQSARGARRSQGSAQTRKKEQLFGESLERFERQLIRVEKASASSTQATVPKKSAGRKGANRKVPAKVAAKGAKGRGKSTVSTKQPKSKKTGGTKKTAASTPKVKKTTKAAKKKVSKTTKTARRKAASHVAKSKAERAEAAKNLRRKSPASPSAVSKRVAKRPASNAATAAKKARKKASGQVRTQKHVSARGRRTQARRDSR